MPKTLKAEKEKTLSVQPLHGCELSSHGKEQLCFALPHTPDSAPRVSHCTKLVAAYLELSACLLNRKPCYLFICLKLQIKWAVMFTLQWYLYSKLALNNSCCTSEYGFSCLEVRNQRNWQSDRSVLGIHNLINTSVCYAYFWAKICQKNHTYSFYFRHLFASVISPWVNTK